MDANENVGLEERLKSALWLSIGKIVDEETIKLGVNATPQFIGALTELVWVQIDMEWSAEMASGFNLGLGLFIAILCPFYVGKWLTEVIRIETASQDLESFAK
ncbi:hypothetical protein AN0598.2 [Aspergillus nidulans FGSC A4]|nr:hypothetical protein AN0598.2 [Aspergillus nidulans FGSC A4]|eukprot:XP_658202.1 hypothetical protein AN0598.2 [Aspergillus nidulans FGSC A4]